MKTKEKPKACRIQYSLKKIKDKRKAGKRKEEDNEDQLQAVYQYFKKDF